MRDYIGLLLNGFFFFFFLIYIVKFGFKDFIISGDDTWTFLVNMGIWYVLTKFCMDGLVRSSVDKPSITLKRHKDSHTTKGESSTK